MRKIFFPIVVFLLAITMLTCDRSTNEPDLKISIDAPAYNETNGPDFNFSVRIESEMPPDGVKIICTVRGEADNFNYPQGPEIETAAKISSLRLINLPRQKFCIATVRVISISKGTNNTSKDFRVVYK
ncbi:MAG TPA: hypothetical protein VFH08_04245 [Chitinophagaceae bacterium]|nr:hypothetical protein [Chitinophagaceae bacterium]